MDDEVQQKLREAFKPEVIGKLPRITCPKCRDSSSKCCPEHHKVRCNGCRNYITDAHMHIDYVGHAHVTDRLLDVDPEWTWEPVGFDERGAPLMIKGEKETIMWIKLTIGGHSRLGVGSVENYKSDIPKQLIGDAIRNAAMRFGVALDLWAKSELESQLEDADDGTTEADRTGEPDPRAELLALIKKWPDDDRRRGVMRQEAETQDWPAKMGEYTLDQAAAALHLAQDLNAEHEARVKEQQAEARAAKAAQVQAELDADKAEREAMADV